MTIAEIERDLEILKEGNAKLKELNRQADELNSDLRILKMKIIRDSGISPEDFYKKLDKVPFVRGESNYYIRDCNGEYEADFYQNHNSTVSGTEYISKEDAIMFCEIFNKCKAVD